eukprot:CAMPEP_0174256650 /NCGR_PEP_ID=MMETSP0439-20130205/5864_1 /TAXON_ID=0 /ORGANISM="Stereomyxa ramosa, Strain Chinc5" /LENGTH=502 /DNA_ID=CAMNT_0015339363 /DNA_START=150 /DNA_END=1658 /DNA_ORIENTATION=+
MKEESEFLKVCSWNIAAVNNNPFEYWITYDENPAYGEMMAKVEEFLEEPGDYDVPVADVFTQEMFETLLELMEKEGWEGLKSVEDHWVESYKDRKIISEFIKDREIGSKRLTSMPDRFTNTINVKDGQVYRPTIINMYEGKFESVDEWFVQWTEFMFDLKMKIKSRGEVKEKRPCELLQKISKAKYPAITPEEEDISIPLQTVLLAVFDSILVHMIETVAHGKWMDIKAELCEKLNKNKVPRTLEILNNNYADSDVIFLQEAAAAFIDEAEQALSGFVVVAPEKLDSRDQNSLVLVNSSVFSDVVDVSEQVYEQIKSVDKTVPISAGDLLVITCKGKDEDEYVLASFHGDTNGLATIPVVGGVHEVVEASFPNHKLIFGLDANTYEKGSDGFQGVEEFAAFFTSKGMTSCWGDKPDPKNYTTFNARTYLQPQLNKACKSSDKSSKADINPKDFILFYTKSFSTSNSWKDNTGKGEYVEGMVFPTIQFPSDHGIISTILTPAK